MSDEFDPDFSHLPVANLRCCRQSSPRGHGNVRPRGTGDWLLVFTHQGAGTARSADAAAILNPGDLLLYAPQDSQDYRTAPDSPLWVHSWVHFVPKPSWLPFLQWRPGIDGLRILRNKSCPELEPAFDRMVQAYWSHPRTFWKELSFNALEEIILRAWQLQDNPDKPVMDGRIRKAVDWLIGHLTEPFDMEDLADHAGLSVSALSHRFRQETGESPRRFQERCRMDLAKDLLTKTPDSISGIAYSLGFSSPFYFTRRYREYFGQSPSQTRDKT